MLGHWTDPLSPSGTASSRPWPRFLMSRNRSPSPRLPFKRLISLEFSLLPGVMAHGGAGKPLIVSLQPRWMWLICEQGIAAGIAQRCRVQEGNLAVPLQTLASEHYILRRKHKRHIPLPLLRNFRDGIEAHGADPLVQALFKGEDPRSSWCLVYRILNQS